MLRLPAICGFLVLALSGPLQARDGCAQSQLEKATLRVKGAQEQLLANKVDEMNSAVPPSIQQQIRAMKDALAAAVDLSLQCQQDSAIDIGRLQIRLAGVLGANKPEQPANSRPGNFPEEAQNIYGSELRVLVSRSEDEANMVGVKVSFGVACGRDTLLLLYFWRDKAWQQVLRWQSGDYSTASGAFGDFFEYVVIPRRVPNEWSVVVAHGKPWCTSCWSGFDMDVISTAHGANPQAVYHAHHAYYRCEDSGPVLRRWAHGFEIRVNGGSIDFAVFKRPIIYRYLLAGNSVRRVQPVASNGRDFVDEWLQAKWNEAADWTTTANLKGLENEHAAIENLRYPEKPGNGPTFSFGGVRGCSDDPSRFQVTLDMDPGASVYFAIRESDNSFTMLSVSKRPDPLCVGPDLMRKP